MNKWVQKQKGFTIVELLIVIVVIGILAAITIVAYNGAQTRADTVARQSEMMAWKKAFEIYRASEGTWPSGMAPNTFYCLGEGFPIGSGGVARCRDYASSTYGYIESNNATAMSQLKKLVDIPNSPKKPIHGTVGPYARIYSDGSETVEITQVFISANNQCPGGTNQQFRNPVTLWCEIRIKP